MRLVTISLNALPRLPGMRPGDLITIDCDKPNDAMRDWKFVIRGQSAYLVSPPGWVRDRGTARDPKGAVTAYGPLPMNNISLQWQATADELETLYKNAKWESPPFGWTPAPIDNTRPLLDQIPAHQMGD